MPLHGVTPSSCCSVFPEQVVKFSHHPGPGLITFARKCKPMKRKSNDPKLSFSISELRRIISVRDPEAVDDMLRVLDIIEDEGPCIDSDSLRGSARIIYEKHTSRQARLRRQRYLRDARRLELLRQKVESRQAQEDVEKQHTDEKTRNEEPEISRPVQNILIAINKDMARQFLWLERRFKRISACFDKIFDLISHRVPVPLTGFIRETIEYLASAIESLGVASRSFLSDSTPHRPELLTSLPNPFYSISVPFEYSPLTLPIPPSGLDPALASVLSHKPPVPSPPQSIAPGP